MLEIWAEKGAINVLIAHIAQDQTSTVDSKRVNLPKLP